MSRRSFSFDAEQWEVESAGSGHGVGSGKPPPMTRHQVVFTRRSDGSRYREWISTSDVNAASRSELEAALTRALSE
jgi:hypothetical protein